MSQDKQKIIERINKLFSLADTSRNPSEQEVFEALSKAKTLMAEYDLSESDLFMGEAKEKWEFKSEILVSEKQTLDNWQSILIFGVSKLTHTYVTEGGNRGNRYFRISGESVDVGIAIALFTILKKQARRLAEEKFTSRSDRRSYSEGFASGVQQQAREKVKSLSSDSANRYALVSTEKKDWLSRQLKENFGKVNEEGKTLHQRINPMAYSQGQKDGYASETSYNQKALNG